VLSKSRTLRGQAIDLRHDQNVARAALSDRAAKATAIRVNPHEMLAEFEIVDGTAIRKPMRRFFFGLKDLLLGGVEDIETILLRGERLPTWKEVGFAALDVTIIAGGVGAVAKTARLGIGTAEAVEKSAVRLAAEGAAEKNSVRLVAEGAAGNDAMRVAAEGAYEAISAVAKTGVLVAQWHLHTLRSHGRNSSHQRAAGSPNGSAAIASPAFLLST